MPTYDYGKDNLSFWKRFLGNLRKLKGYLTRLDLPEIGMVK
jgi:hypothetical protein